MLTPRRFILLNLFFIIMWTSCTEESITPEDCVRQYAQYINQGKLEEAKNMCTPSGQAFLDALGEIITASASSLDTNEIKIKSVECQQTNDTIHCISLEYDGFEDYEKEYWLVQSDRGWLIDHPTNKGAIKNSEEVLETGQK